MISNNPDDTDRQAESPRSQTPESQHDILNGIFDNFEQALTQISLTIGDDREFAKAFQRIKDESIRAIHDSYDHTVVTATTLASNKALLTKLANELPRHKKSSLDTDFTDYHAGVNRGVALAEIDIEAERQQLGKETKQ